MQTIANAIENNALTALAKRAAPAVVNAIKSAAEKTGVNFAYLMEQAAAESSFRTDAKARTSSASGLYQFIESTWMGMVRDHGEKYGLDHYADAIDARGRVKDAGLRREILSLRNDPEIAALMAGEFAADNQRYLERFGDNIGDIGATELYMAHFLGAGGAASFLKTHKNNPVAVAADIMPEAARANYNVFYNSKTGKPRTVAEVYDFFDKKFTASKQGGTMIAAQSHDFSGAGYDQGGIPLRMASATQHTTAQHAATHQADTIRSRAAAIDAMMDGNDQNRAAEKQKLRPEFSPFAHLNQRRPVADDYADGHEMRTVIRTAHGKPAETIHWNGPRITAIANPVQVMLMAQTAPAAPRGRA